MKRICGWCRSGESAVPVDESITHGVCPQCEEGLFKRLGLGVGMSASSPNQLGGNHAVETNSDSIA